MGARGDDPRLEPGFHRWHCRERRAARAPTRFGRYCHRRPVGHRSVLALAGRASTGRWFDGRPLRKKENIRYRRDDFRGRLCLVRSCFRYRTIDRRSRGAGNWCGLVGSGKPRDHQQFIFRGETRQGHRDLVWLQRDHRGDRPCAGRMAG